MLTFGAFTFGDALLTALELALLFLWIWAAAAVFVDIFRSHDLSGWAKALWVLLIFVLPYFGVFVYLIFRGGQMHERAARFQRSSAQQFWDHHPGLSTADELAKLAELRDRGELSPEEFEREKAKLLGPRE
jgi:hypothetical protein